MDKLIGGKAVAAQVRAEVADRMCALEERTGVSCGLATILVGDAPASMSSSHRPARVDPLNRPARGRPATGRA